MADLPTGGPSTSLVTIHFEDITKPGGADIIRHWYHVPRVGDELFLLTGRSDSATVEGTVKVVFWGDDYVLVRFR